MEMTVTRREDLKAALDQKPDILVIEGRLAKQVRTSRKIKSVGPAALAILVASIAAIPLTGGASFLLAGPIAASAGVSVVLVLALLSLGLWVVFAIWGDYEEMEWQGMPPRLKLKRKAEQGI